MAPGFQPFTGGSWGAGGGLQGSLPEMSRGPSSLPLRGARNESATARAGKKQRARPAILYVCNSLQFPRSLASATAAREAPWDLCGVPPRSLPSLALLLQPRGLPTTTSCPSMACSLCPLGLESATPEPRTWARASSNEFGEHHSAHSSGVALNGFRTARAHPGDGCGLRVPPPRHSGEGRGC